MSVSALAERKSRLIRKALDAAVFCAHDDATPITAITTGAQAELITLDPDYVSLGHHSEEEGVNWTREVENADTRSHGSQEPTRRDITSDVSGLTVVAQETKMKTLEMFHNVDLSAVEADPTTGEIAFNRAVTPATRYYRVLTVAQDGAGDDAIYFARFLPRASVTEFSEQEWTKETELRYELSLTAYVDEDLGYAMREMWGGPGLAAVLSDMGFSVASSSS